LQDERLWKGGLWMFVGLGFAENKYGGKEISGGLGSKESVCTI